MSKTSQSITSNLVEFELLLSEVEDNFLGWIYDEQLIQGNFDVLDDIHEFTKTGDKVF